MKYKSKLKVDQIETILIKDLITDEITGVESKVHTYLTKDKDTYFLCYSSILGIINDLSFAEIKVFNYCLRFTDGTRFTISKGTRIEISNITGINERTILNILPVLVSKTLLIKHPVTNMYEVNPTYAFQGSTLERHDRRQFLFQMNLIK